MTLSAYPGFAHDLDPDALVLADGAAVAAWGAFTQATAGFRPVYRAAAVNGHGAVEFDGTDDTLEKAGDAATAAFTLYLVVKATAYWSPAASKGLLSIDAIPALSRHTFVRQRMDNLGGVFVEALRFYSGGSSVQAKTFADPTEWNLITVVGTASEVRLYANGLLYDGGAAESGGTFLENGTVAIPTAPNAGTATIKLARNDAAYWAGRVARVGLYWAAHAEADRRAIEAELAAAYALTVSATPEPIAEVLTPTTTAAVAAGFGVQITMANQWEYATAAALGATVVRLPLGWDTLESMAGALLTPASLTNALAWCALYGLEPIFAFAFGPPNAQTHTFTVNGPIASGTRVVAVDEDVSALAALVQPGGPGTDPVPQYFLGLTSGGTLGQGWITADGQSTYNGALIVAVDTGARTITVGFPTNQILADGAALRVRTILYPAVRANTPADAGVVGFFRVVEHLATVASQSAVTAATVEFWNEPPWSRDRWDEAKALCQTGVPPASWETGTIAALFTAGMSATPPARVRYISSWTHKSGLNSVLNIAGVTEAGATAAGMRNAIHPYANDPEGYGFRPWWPGYPPLSGVPSSLSFRQSFWQSEQHRRAHGWTVRHEVDECGEQAAEPHKSRHYCRTLLYWLGTGEIDRVTFFELKHAAEATYSFVNAGTQAFWTSGVTMQRLLAQYAAYPAAPLAYAAGPTVTAVAGAAFPVMALLAAGRPSAAAAENTYLLALWQRSYTGLFGGGARWETLSPRPAAAAVEVALPAGFAVAAADAVNLTTGAVVPVAASALSLHRLTLDVADDAVLVRLLPPTAFDARAGGARLGLRTADAAGPALGVGARAAGAALGARTRAGIPELEVLV